MVRALLVIPISLLVAMTGCSKQKDPPIPPSASAPAPSMSVASASPSVPASADAAATAKPLYYARKITASDLEGRSLRELALIRNLPYARAGKRFRKSWLTEYFTSQAWYT